MKEMTAVERLVKQLEEKGESWENVSIGRIQISIKVEDYLNLIEQANAMFEEQIKLAFTQGELFSGDFYDPNNPKVDCSENYYNETYNQ
jgi:hypothetical protein